MKIFLSSGFILIAVVAFPQNFMQPLDEWTIQVNNQFRHFERELGLTSQSHNMIIGSLQDDSHSWVLIEMEPGFTYKILGVCDHDCFNLDLELYALTDDLLSSDYEADDFPLVSITPSVPSTYRLKVIMEDCTDGPCRFGVNVYRLE